MYKRNRFWILFLVVAFFCSQMAITALANPEDGVAEVESWAAFLTAVADPGVTVIDVVGSIDAGNTNANIERELRITSSKGSTISFSDYKTYINVFGNGILTIDGDLNIEENRDKYTPIAVHSGGKIKINGGSIEAKAKEACGVLINEEGSVDFNGGSIEASGEEAYGFYIDEDGSLDVAGGNIEAKGKKSYGVHIDGDGSVDFNGGHLKASGNLSCAAEIWWGELNIRGGTIEATHISSVPINVYFGAVNISRGTVKGPSIVIFSMGGKVNLSGGLIKGEAIERVQDNHTLGIVSLIDNVVNITGGKIEIDGDPVGIGIHSIASTLSINDGEIDVSGESCIAVLIEGESNANTITGGLIKATRTVPNSCAGIFIMPDGNCTLTTWSEEGVAGGIFAGDFNNDMAPTVLIPLLANLPEPVTATLDKGGQIRTITLQYDPNDIKYEIDSDKTSNVLGTPTVDGTDVEVRLPDTVGEFKLTLNASQVVESGIEFDFELIIPVVMEEGSGDPPYDPTQDNADITAAIANIEGATYTATQAEAGDANAALAKAQALVNALELKGTTATLVAGDFTAAVAGTAGSPAGTDGSFTFTVKVNKGSGTEKTSAEQTMTITATAYDPTQDNADITAAIANIEGATYTATQAEAGDANAALAKAQALVNALELKGTTATLVAGDFTAAVAGTAGSPAGTDGSFKFTVKVNKGGGTEKTSADQTMTITATAYNPAPVAPPADPQPGRGGGIATEKTTSINNVEVPYTLANGKLTLKTNLTKIDQIISNIGARGVLFDFEDIADLASVELSGNLLASIESKKSALTVKMPLGTMTLSNETIASISDKIGEKDMAIEFRQVGMANLTKDQREVVGQEDLILDINIISGQEKIKDFDGLLEMTVPYNGPLPVGLWYLNDSGELERLDCRYSDGMVYFNLDHLSLYVLAKDPDLKNPFVDVKESDWFYDAVVFIAQRGITSGTSATTFSPADNLSRGQFITMLLRAYDIEPDPTAGDNFKDAGKTYYTGYLAAAKAMGIASGVGGNNFAPQKDITRQEMFTLLHRTLMILNDQPSTDSGKSLADFSDKNIISDWAEEALEDLVKWGIVAGNDGKINPFGTTTRAEMAQVLFRIFAVKEHS